VSFLEQWKHLRGLLPFQPCALAARGVHASGGAAAEARDYQRELAASAPQATPGEPVFSSFSSVTGASAGAVSATRRTNRRGLLEEGEPCSGSGECKGQCNARTRRCEPSEPYCDEPLLRAQ
jgi:coenzyme F420-reducing hydrogenase gamma subunit